MSRQLDAEVRFIDEVDQGRPLQPGELAPRQRIARLVDPGSWLEIGRLARSQQPKAEDGTPADGLITGWATIGGRTTAVMAEDPLVLSRTDGQVADDKRRRLLATAAQRDAPLIALLDGPAADTDGLTFGPLDGRLFGHLADNRPAPMRPARCLVGVFGRLTDAGAILAADSAIVVGSGATSSDVIDGRIPTDADTVDALRRVVSMVTRSGAALTRLDATAAAHSFDTDRADGFEAIDALADAGSVIGLRATPSVQSGLCRLEGFAVTFVAGSGDLGADDVAVIRRANRIAERLGTALLLVQNSQRYATDVGSSAPLARAVSGLIEEVRASPVPKICVVTGRGNVLGTFALGGHRLGIDYTVAWPWAAVGVNERDSGDGGPWVAAGMGLIDDVITPEETRPRIGRMLDLLANTLVIPTPEQDLRGRLVEEISKV